MPPSPRPQPLLTRVVNYRRGQYDVYIGRPSKWGNPYAIGRDPSGGTWSRSDVVRLYKAWIQTQPALLAALGELKGKRLGCYCKPLACHGDVLADLANALPEETSDA